MGVSEPRFAQIGALEIGVLQNRASEIGAAQVRSTQIRACQVSAGAAVFAGEKFVVGLENIGQALAVVLNRFGFVQPHIHSPTLDSTFYFTGIVGRQETHKRLARVCYCAFIVGDWYVSTVAMLSRRTLAILLAVVVAAGFCAPWALAQSRSQDNEIVTSLTGGRGSLHVAKDASLFSACEA